MEEKALKVFESILGCWYLWGGEKPPGVDCSGAVQWVLRQLGVLLPFDHTARAMWNRFRKVFEPRPGVLAFLGKLGVSVWHVMMVHHIEGDYVWCIGAHGGNSQTVTLEVAKRQNAKVSIKKFHKSKILGYRALPGSALQVAEVSSDELVPNELVREEMPDAELC